MFRMLTTLKILMFTVAVAMATAGASRSASRRRDERGTATEWLIVVGATIGIAYFASDAVMAFAKGVVGGLGK